MKRAQALKILTEERTRKMKVRRYERHATITNRWFCARIWYYSMKLEIGDTSWKPDWTADETREYAKFLLAAADILEELKNENH